MQYAENLRGRIFGYKKGKWEDIMKKNKKNETRPGKAENKKQGADPKGKQAPQNDQKVEDQSNYEYRANDEDLKDDKRKNYSESGKFSGGAQSQEAGDQGNAKSNRVRKGPSTQ